ncbi:hypothetical protein BJ742DRAFT_909404 [Cladochytrium replicatum]|nr:hypothetical protein BJ742DRAFT_909404 [Cladochytrium replicatum]
MILINNRDCVVNTANRSRSFESVRSIRAYSVTIDPSQIDEVAQSFGKTIGNLLFWTVFAPIFTIVGILKNLKYIRQISASYARNIYLEMTLFSDVDMDTIRGQSVRRLRKFAWYVLVLPVFASLIVMDIIVTDLRETDMRNSSPSNPTSTRAHPKRWKKSRSKIPVPQKVPPSTPSMRRKSTGATPLAISPSSRIPIPAKSHVSPSGTRYPDFR